MSPSLSPLYPRTVGLGPARTGVQGFGLIPNEGVLGKGRVWCGAQGRTQTIPRRLSQHFHSASGVGTKDALASG